MKNKIKHPIFTEIETGKKIGSFSCQYYRLFGDIVVVWGLDQSCKVLTKAGLEKKKIVLYEWKGATISRVEIPPKLDLLILHTAKENCLFRDFDNQEIEDADNWISVYTEPFTKQFYRQDVKGHWFDVEGHKLSSPIFLQDDVLVSLSGKSSKKSLSFRGQNLLVSPRFSLIQIGKLLLDSNLKPVLYYGEKTSGLGNKNIAFASGRSVQKIRLGFDKYAFLWEDTLQPFTIEGVFVMAHLASFQKGKHRLELFQTEDETYYTSKDDSGEAFRCDGEVVTLDFDSYLKVGRLELMLGKQKERYFYLDINEQTTFKILSISPQAITFIDHKGVKVKGDWLWNMATNEEQFVYNDTKGERFSLEEGQLLPTQIQEPPSYATHFGMVQIEGVQKMYYKQLNKCIQFEEGSIEIAEIKSSAQQKLLNAKSVAGELLVLDVRKGFHDMELAFSTDQQIIEVYGEAVEVGNMVLQNALLKTLGGTERRVIDLNKNNLAIFTLPADLKIFPGDGMPSLYANNPIHSLDFEKGITIEEEHFIPAIFIPYYDTPTAVLIQQKNARPLHLEGAVHKNELVTHFDTASLTSPLFLGHHRMIAAATITEDHQEESLLFSLDKKRTWLLFRDGFLPAFRKVVRLQTSTNWDYWLFEIRGELTQRQYMAVEQKAPYRLLVEKKRKKEIPKLINSNEHALKTPEELNLIEKIIQGDPGVLREI